MAGKKLEYEVKVDASDATSELKKVGKAGEQAGKDLASGFKDVASKSQSAIDKVVNGLNEVATESKNTIRAVDAIGKAFGDGFDPQSAAQLVSALRQAGAEFDDIEHRAGELATTMRQLDDVKLDGNVQSLRRVGDELDHTGQRGVRAAETFQSGIGPLRGLTDEFGQTSVIAGTMSNAIIDAGEAVQIFGGALGFSEAALGGISAALGGVGIAVGVLIPILGKIFKGGDNETEKKVREITAALADQIGLLDEYQSSIDDAFGQGAADVIDVFTESVLKSIEATKGDDFITGLETALGRLGVVRRQFGEIAAESQQDQAAWLADLLELHGVVPALAGDIADYYTGLSTGTDATVEWARANPELAASFLKVSDALGEARKDNNLATQDFLDNQASINEGTKALVNAAIAAAAAQADATGAQFTWNDALQAYIALQQQVLQVGNGIATASDAQAQAAEDTRQALEDQTTAVADGIQAWKDYAASVQEATIEVGKAIAEPIDIAGALETEFGKVNDLFDGLAFDVDFKPAMNDALDDLASFKPDFQTLADEWEDILSGKNVKIFGNVRADDDEFLELTGKVRDLFQGGIKNEFEQGGVEAANTFAQSVAAQIASKTGLSIEEVYRIMGLPPDGSITTLIEPEVDAQHADQARAILDSLAGVEGGEAREARIHVALETGQIDGDVAYIASLLLAHEALGINVEPQLAAFTPEQIAQAQAVIDGTGGVTIPVTPEVSDNWFDNLWATPPAPVPVPVPVELTADNAGAVDEIIDAVAEKRRLAKLDVKAPDAGKVGKLIDAVADKARDAEITIKPVNLSSVDSQLDTLAMPTEDGRLAHIFAQPDNIAAAAAALDGVAGHRNAQISVRADNAGQIDQILDDVANPNGRPRTAEINVVTRNTVITTPGASGGGGPTAVPGLAPTGFAAEGITPFADESSGGIASSFATPIGVPGGASTSSSPQVVHNHVTVQAAVIGSRFDVQRAVSKALRQAQRLNGTRAA